MTAQPTAVPRPDTGPGDGPRKPVSARKNRVRRLSGGDLVVVTLMTVIPTLFVLALVWLPAIASVLLSFTNWNGIGSLSRSRRRLRQLRERRDQLPAVLARVAAQPDVPRGPLPHRDADRHVPRGAAGQGDAVQPLLPDRDLPAGRAEPGPRRLHLAADLLARPGPAQRGAAHAGRLVRRPELQPVGRARGHQLAAHRLHHAAVPGRAEGGGRVAARGRRDRRRDPRCRRSSGSSSR